MGPFDEMHRSDEPRLILFLNITGGENPQMIPSEMLTTKWNINCFLFSVMYTVYQCTWQRKLLQNINPVCVLLQSETKSK